jgi:hypothetical protein
MYKSDDTFVPNTAPTARVDTVSSPHDCVCTTCALFGVHASFLIVENGDLLAQPLTTAREDKEVIYAPATQ